MRNPFKYPLSKEYFFIRFIVLSVSNPVSIFFWNIFAKFTSFILHNKKIIISTFKLDSGATVKIIRSKKFETKKLPVIVYFHGGGFVFSEFGPQEELMYRYIDAIDCVVVSVDYRLCPQNTYPAAFEDAYDTLMSVLSIAEKYNIDSSKIIIMGDSAGGNLAATVAIKARDNHIKGIIAQVLIYPVIDNRMITKSAIEYRDTPVWNSYQSSFMWKFYLPNGLPNEHPEYAVPNINKNMFGLPKSYIETAEFDSLRDEAIQYADNLKLGGVDVTLVNTKGTCHGFELINCTTTETSIIRRINFINQCLGKVTIDF